MKIFFWQGLGVHAPSPPSSGGFFSTRQSGVGGASVARVLLGGLSILPSARLLVAWMKRCVGALILAGGILCLEGRAEEGAATLDEEGIGFVEPTLEENRCLQLSSYCGGCSGVWDWRAPHGTYHVHYVERGTGDEHMVLIHGFSANTFSWRSCIEPLARAGFHVWALDLIGFGASAKPQDAPYCFDLFVEQVRAFLAAKGIEHPHLVGHSMGGFVTLGVAMRVPHLLKTITLVDAIGYPQEMPWLFTISKGLGEWLAPLLSRSTIARMLGSTIQAGQTLDDETIDAYWLPLASEGGKKAAIAVLAHFDNERFEKASLGFRGINLPTLVVWGQDDELVPVSHAYRFHRDLKRSHLRVFPRCGHSPQEECAEQFVLSVTHFAQRYTQKRADPEEEGDLVEQASL